MSQLVTIQQAARNALAKWLRTELAPVRNGLGVVVEPRWFPKDVELPRYAVSIIDAGPREVEWTDPEILDQTLKGAAHVEVTWGLGYVTQRLQLDVWTPSDLELDDVVARLDIALNAGQRPMGASNPDPVAVGVLVLLEDGWEGATADLTFDAPETQHTPSSVNESEWRATYRGAASMRLAIKATSARMARVKVHQRLSNDELDVTSTASGDTYTSV